jgi:prepilin-type N-terminal cleavage/methylation domain-containing protein
VRGVHWRRPSLGLERVRFDRVLLSTRVSPGAFTLVEMLVVTVIIAVLASVLLPALARAHKRSYVAICLSNLKQMGLAVGLYNGDNAEQYPFSGREWPQMPFVDFLILCNPYISTNNRSFYRCPADRGRGNNFEWVLTTKVFPITTNELPFPCSYYYYSHFYRADDGTAYMTRRTTEVRFPAQKAQIPCFVSSTGPGYDSFDNTFIDGHGLNGMLLLMADGHSQFARYRQLNLTYLHPKYPSYNLDWTVGGLSGADLK